jgi:hypothetical protein
MALTPAITVSQEIGDESILTITDESTGSDGAIAARRVYLQLADGSYLKPSGNTTDYILWAYANSSIDIDVLGRDYAIFITVFWVNSSGNTLYSKSGNYLFTLYSEQFLYGLTQAQAANYPIIQDQNYYQNKGMLITEIDSASNAVSIGGDILAAQNCLDRAAYMIANQNDFF